MPFEVIAIVLAVLGLAAIDGMLFVGLARLAGPSSTTYCHRCFRRMIATPRDHQALCPHCARLNQ